ncbi:hypothetical protein XBLMG947_0986 [Xanthomonas bromi]|uniref:Uncharacterized protein n=1 Tax=Xanthomonas bromi TaxID=56449 RepID=A0A1C3NII3_9XANT|nr:hypothetical protein [Xanthomonas bromi]PPV08083.1 hypothetical protein XbrCFBP1976_05220 [Xanthomonas bromi]SBV50209.1 hypothetical protein XBLMG947_0986 [Xanthomonas bromi]
MDALRLFGNYPTFERETAEARHILEVFGYRQLTEDDTGPIEETIAWFTHHHPEGIDQDLQR